MRESDITDIRNLALFRDMDADHFECLMRGAYMQVFPEGVTLIEEGQNPDFLYIVAEGCVELFAQWNGRETVMGFARPVTTFILAATITDGPFLKSARTTETSRIIMLPSSDVRGVFSTDAAFARAVVGELAKRYRVIVKDAKNVKLRTGIERVANYLLRLADAAPGQKQICLDIEKRKLAAFLGMTPENLSRSLKALQQHGVELNGSTIMISSHEALAALAHATPLIDEYEA